MNKNNNQAQKSEKKSPIASEEWKTIIIDQCSKLGYMNEAFVPMIDTLAQILERRDLVFKEFIDQGAKVTVDKISDRRAVNKAKNPLYTIWYELNKQALAYWYELGCTPRSVVEIEKKNNELMNEFLRELQEYEKASIKEETSFMESVKMMWKSSCQDQSETETDAGI